MSGRSTTLLAVALLEAMAVETPVAAVRTSAIPEVAGDAALLVEDGDQEALTDGLRRLLTDNSLREDLVSRGLKRCRQFSWRDSAEKLLSLYSELE